VTWRDVNHLVIEPNDVRSIIATNKNGDLRAFICGDAGAQSQDYNVDANEQFGGGFVVSGPRYDK
jgi:hypothetical protein